MEMTNKYKIILNNWDKRKVTELAQARTCNEGRVIFREKCKELKKSGFDNLANIDLVRVRDDEIIETRYLNLPRMKA